ncbi:MAG: HAMP domain-containing histidine kinase [Candidatus Eremiobacteraeota bacterium]|nr:HAMP domain-containing histidine kinase [Candidatus Eremiobacteraeota bacterium]
MSILQEIEPENVDPVLDRIKGISYISRDFGHAIRNNLSIMNNAAEVIRMRMKTEDPKMIKCIDVIKEEVEKGEAMLESLNFLGSITKGAKKNPVDLNEALDQALKEIESELEAKKIKLIKNCPKFPLVSGDRWQLKEAFASLFKNALEAMGTDGTLELQGETADSKVILKIKDSGSGMDQVALEKAFDPFFSGRGKRMGLGLPLAYAVIKNLKGQIKLESSPGKGTSVILEIPIGETGIEGGKHE